jgi:hypothetical protein
MEEFVANAFDVLSDDDILHILSRMTPPNVMRLCDSFDICTEAMFKFLMRRHYPNVDPSPEFSYSEQYSQLADEYTTAFRIPVLIEESRLDLDNIERGEVNDFNQSLLVVYDDPPHGLATYVYSVFQPSQADWNSYAYPTRAQMMKEAYIAYSQLAGQEAMSFQEFEEILSEPNSEITVGTYVITVDEIILP